MHMFVNYSKNVHEPGPGLVVEPPPQGQFPLSVYSQAF